MNSKEYRYTLNKTTHFVRPSQLVYHNGIGSMVEFPSQTLMTASHRYWGGYLNTIRDERLESILQVRKFQIPSTSMSSEERDGSVSFVRFPEWYFCPQCRVFKPINLWVDDYQRRNKHNKHNKHMHNSLFCSTCSVELTVARLVSICEHGHIDDFPWIYWAHSKSGSICSNPKLKLTSNYYSSEGLDNIVVECTNCNNKRNLVGSLNNDINIQCTGRHPWNKSKEKCENKMRGLLRGASSIYYPVTISSIIIPSQTEESEKLIISSQSFKNILSLYETIDLSDDAFDKYVDKSVDNLQDETGLSKQHIKNIIINKLNEDSRKNSYNDTIYLYQEYLALTGIIEPDQSSKKDFECEQMNLIKYSIPWLKKISLVHKLREVRVQVGFSRLYPIENIQDLEGNKNFVSIKANGIDWLPATEVKGEGIFIEFDDILIEKWISKNDSVVKRISYLQSIFNSNQQGKINHKIDIKFMLLHTFSHLLIKQLTIDSGYSISSIRERIYCSKGDDNQNSMQGILIYTASGDSEGTLGGLVRQGRSDYFPRIIDKAIQSAMICSNDPICMSSMGQGRSSTNLAACHSCTLLPETSCVEFNSYLDRALIIGSYEDENLGFFNYVSNILGT